MAGMLSYALMAASVLIGVIGQLLLKVGMDAAGRVEGVDQLTSWSYMSRVFGHWHVPVALCLYGLGAFLWMAVLSRERLTVAYPFLGLTYVAVLLVGVLILGEQVTVPATIGTIMVAAGVCLIAWGG